MPAAVSPNPRAGSTGPDDLDNLLDYDDAVNDFFKDLPQADDNNATSAPAEPAKDIDEEIKITKKRKPNPKLDQDRLLSDAGVPKLRRLAKNRLQFKGKGHEFTDISRMLNLYQLWLDDLYPKAKFKDGLTMIEKLGHSKRLQVSRRAWMDETKPFRRREDEDEEMQDAGDGAEKDDDPIFGEAAGGSSENQRNEAGIADGPADDELDALFAEESNKTQSDKTQNPQASRRDDDGGPDDDELDALLAAEPRASEPSIRKDAPKKGPFEDDEDSDQDELDALMAEESSRKESSHIRSDGAQPNNQNGQQQDQSFDDDEEAMQEMGW